MKKSGLADSPLFSTPTGSKPLAPPPETDSLKKPIETIVEENETDLGFHDQSTDQSTSQSIDPSIDQSINRLIDRPIDSLNQIDSLGPVIGKPRGFYLTQKVDRWLDGAVLYLKEKGLHKVDRSVLVNALLHDPGLYTQENLDKMRSTLLTHITNRSLRRSRSTIQSTD